MRLLVKQELSETAGRAEQEQEAKQVLRKQQSSNSRRPRCGTLRFVSQSEYGGQFRQGRDGVPATHGENTANACSPSESGSSHPASARTTVTLGKLYNISKPQLAILVFAVLFSL